MGANEVGPFTPQINKVQLGATAELTVLQCRMLTSLREMRSLDKGLRNLHSGEKVHIKETKTTGKNASSDELVSEIKMWFDKFVEMQNEMDKSRRVLEEQVSKGQKQKQDGRKGKQGEEQKEKP